MTTQSDLIAKRDRSQRMARLFATLHQTVSEMYAEWEKDPIAWHEEWPEACSTACAASLDEWCIDLQVARDALQANIDEANDQLLLHRGD